jgi:hypothetical protein
MTVFLAGDRNLLRASVGSGRCVSVLRNARRLLQEEPIRRAGAHGGIKRRRRDADARDTSADPED